MVKSPMEQRIIDALETLAAEHGVDIVDVEMAGATKAPCVRVIDPVAGSYTLEVSSPGMARPLRRPRDFARFTGEDVDLVTTATEGRRKFKGRIAGATEEAVTLALEGDETVTIPFAEVKKCTLKPVFDFKGGAKKEGKN